ncbi:hypothetical protein KBZ10_03110 [Streptomyces sp. F63]|uniref:hypothetical protein n=1 Tax=Streptomyces sp. F63 TaxID=2824887 RepID=UPI001B375013|nr:hypothetical protein [Streptomyces sp. F63]MBQ0983535.1 hypothetical protein [Streptomyces sp. F63]
MKAMDVQVVPRILRRRSWPIIFGILVVGLGVGMSFAVLKVSSMSGFRTGWQGVPIYLALAGVSGRIANCKVVLREADLLVINPLRTHTIPLGLIGGASVSDDGTLEVRIDEYRKIPAFAFGGSLIDHYVGSSEGAKRKIDDWLDSRRPVSEVKTTLLVRWTRCTPADFSLALSVVISVAGAVWMALSGSS